MVAGSQLLPFARHRERFRRWLVLLLAPFTVSLGTANLVAASTGVSLPTYLWWMLIIAFTLSLVVYLAAYSPIADRPIRAFVNWRRRKRFKRPHVLILDGRLNHSSLSPPVPTIFTTKRPDDWRRALQDNNRNWTVRLATVSQVESESPEIVVNPFGECFPEEDPALHTTLTRLSKYVERGGVLVNVAGYPFWWQYDVQARAQKETGWWEQLKQPAGNPTLIVYRTLLTELFGVAPDMTHDPFVAGTEQDEQEKLRFGEIAGAGGNPDVVLFRDYSAKTAQMIPLLRSTGGKSIVIGALRYGAGVFLFAGVEIDSRAHSFEKVLAAIRGWAKYEATGDAAPN